MKRQILLTSSITFISLLALFLYVRLTDRSEEVSFAEARRGYFEITVEATGELIAENSVDITGPNLVGNRRFRASPLRITDLVPEGTEVKKGDYVAELDRTTFLNTLRDEQEELETEKINYESKVLDSAVVLSTLRDEIWNQQFIVSEAGITLEQSKFEPPAVQRQAEIALDKSERTLEQKKKQYELKQAQVRAELMNLRLKVNVQQRIVDDLQTVLGSFTVTAPADGMVIYKKDQLGQKIKTGTNISPWEPVVATLPDLSSMLSKIYVSEIEINKVAQGLPVEMTVDAFPDRYFRGEVSSIANIGEQLPNSDTRVFEVLVKLDEFDPALRPSMTTNNKIVVKQFYDVIFVPNESVHAGSDRVPYVYTKDRKKQIVVPGESNGRNIIIEQGLEYGNKVWVSMPENPEKFSLAGTELIPVIREKEREVARLERERLLKYNEDPDHGYFVESGFMGGSD